MIPRTGQARNSWVAGCLVDSLSAEKSELQNERLDGKSRKLKI